MIVRQTRTSRSSAGIAACSGAASRGRDFVEQQADDSSLPPARIVFEMKTRYLDDQRPQQIRDFRSPRNGREARRRCSARNTASEVIRGRGRKPRVGRRLEIHSARCGGNTKLPWSVITDITPATAYRSCARRCACRGSTKPAGYSFGNRYDRARYPI